MTQIELTGHIKALARRASRFYEIEKVFEKEANLHLHGQEREKFIKNQYYNAGIATGLVEAGVLIFERNSAEEILRA